MHSIAFDPFFSFFTRFFFIFILFFTKQSHTLYITAAVSFLHIDFTTKTEFLWQVMHLELLPFPNLTLPQEMDVVGVIC